MTQDEIISMAREAGATVKDSRYPDLFIASGQELARFAALVAQHEREACAKVCDDFEHPNWDFMEGANLCATAIRTHGEAKNGA